MSLYSFNKLGNKILIHKTLISLTHLISMVMPQQDWTRRLKYGTQFYPELEYDHDFKIRILNDLINLRYRKNDYNTGVQLQLANFEKLYPIIYFDLRNTKESMTGDSKKLEFHYRLNEAANAQNYSIFAFVLNEEEFVLKQIGNELVVV